MAPKKKDEEPPPEKYTPCGVTVQGDKVCTFKGGGDPGLALAGIRDQTDTKLYIQYNSCMDLSPFNEPDSGPEKLVAMKETLTKDIMTAINKAVWKLKKAKEDPGADLSDVSIPEEVVSSETWRKFARVRIVEEAIDRWLKGIKDSPNLLSNLGNPQQCAQAPLLGTAKLQQDRLQPEMDKNVPRVRVPYINDDNKFFHKIGGGTKPCYNLGGEPNAKTSECYYFKATEKSRCWLCGGSWYTTVNNHPLQYNCEHVLPYVEGSLMLGLADTGVNKVPGSLGGSKNKIFDLEYRWSHRLCNLFKNRGQFMDIRDQGLQEKSLLLYAADEEQIKNFCNELVGHDKDPSGLISPWTKKDGCTVGEVWKNCMQSLYNAVDNESKTIPPGSIAGVMINPSYAAGLNKLKAEAEVITSEMNITPIKLREKFIMPVINDIAQYFYGAPIDKPPSAVEGREIIHTGSFTLSTGVILYLKALVICSIVGNLKRPTGGVVGIYAKPGTDTKDKFDKGNPTVLIEKAKRKDVLVNSEGKDEWGDDGPPQYAQLTKAKLIDLEKAKPPYFPDCLWEKVNGKWVFAGDANMIEIYRKALISTFVKIIKVLAAVVDDDEPTGGTLDVSYDTACLFGKALVRLRQSDTNNIKPKGISKKKVRKAFYNYG